MAKRKSSYADGGISSDDVAEAVKKVGFYPLETATRYARVAAPLVKKAHTYVVDSNIKAARGIASALRDASGGLGSAAARAGAARNLEGIRPPSRAALDDMEDAEIARKVDQDMAVEKANKREVDYKKGGSVKGWGKARSARAAKYY